MILNIDTTQLTQSEAEGAISLLRSIFPSKHAGGAVPTPPATGPALASGPILASVASEPSPAAQTPPSDQPEPSDDAPAEPGPAVAEPGPAAKRRPGRPSKAPTKQPDPASSTPITAEALRGVLDSFIQRHSMDEAINTLKAHGCNRVSEALALPADKLNALWAAINA